LGDVRKGLKTACILNNMTNTEDKHHRLYPCDGNKNWNIPRGHVYLAKEPSGEEIGFITHQEAKKKIGRKNYLIYDIDSLCPVCSMDSKIKKRE